MAASSLWADSFVRGPPCRPSVSGRPHADLLQPRRGFHAADKRSRAAEVYAAEGAFSLQLTTERAPPSAGLRIQEIDDVQLDQPSPGSSQGNRPLKINMDLRLYRARLDRIQAQLTNSYEDRKQLLRQAEEGLRRCLALDPTDPRTYVVLGKLLVQQKRFEEARKLYADGTQNSDNTNPYIWSAWGYLEFLTGNISRARKLFDAAIVVDDSHAAAWHKWGMLEMEQGNFLRARDLWTAGIQRCKRAPGKSNCYLYCSLAVMAGQLGKLVEARAWFEEGTRLNEGKSSCALWHAWAMLESRIGDGSAVRYLFKKALEANPRSRYTHLAWALWERKQGNLRSCAQLLQRGIALNPQDPALYQVCGLVELEADNIEGARARFKQGIAVDPRHVHLWQAWAVLEFTQGDLDQARQLFQEGVWADPGNKDVVVVFQAWGVLEERAGNHQLARELFKAALKVDPKNEATWGTWIAMEENLGRVTAANELRIRRSEQQWEFVIPSSFSTRPGGSVFESLLGTLNSFFKVRSSGSGSSNGSSSSSSGAGGAGGEKGWLKSILPSDYKLDMSLEEMIAEATAAALPELASPTWARPGEGPATAAGPASALGYNAGTADVLSSSSQGGDGASVRNSSNNGAEAGEGLGRSSSSNGSSSSSSGSGDLGTDPRGEEGSKARNGAERRGARSLGSKGLQGKAAAAAVRQKRRLPSGVRPPPPRRRSPATGPLFPQQQQPEVAGSPAASSDSSSSL